MSATQQVPPCGTYAAYQAHRKADEEPCDACRVASAAYHRTYRRTHPDAYARHLIAVEVRRRALERLAVEYQHRFLELVAEERASNGLT